MQRYIYTIENLVELLHRANKDAIILVKCVAGDCTVQDYGDYFSQLCKQMHDPDAMYITWMRVSEKDAKELCAERLPMFLVFRGQMFVGVDYEGTKESIDALIALAYTKKGSTIKKNINE